MKLLLKTRVYAPKVEIGIELAGETASDNTPIIIEFYREIANKIEEEYTSRLKSELDSYFDELEEDGMIKDGNTYLYNTKLKRSVFYERYLTLKGLFNLHNIRKGLKNISEDCSMAIEFSLF